jgi:hypothetical protein
MGQRVTVRTLPVGRVGQVRRMGKLTLHDFRQCHQRLPPYPPYLLHLPYLPYLPVSAH